MKKCLYYSIMGGYDTLKEPTYVTPGWDYICFTNNRKLKSNFFKIIYVNYDRKLGHIKLARSVKINFHHHVNDYDLSVYLDGHIQIIGDLNGFVNKYLPPDVDMSITDHPRKKCIYKEAYACKKFKRDSIEIIDSQMEKYKNEGCPENVGMVASGVMIRKHGRENLEKHCELWWQEVKNHSRRDQLSFNYILWKHNLIKINKIDRDEVKGKKGSYIKKRGHYL